MHIQVDSNNYVLCVTSEESVDKNIFINVGEVPEIEHEEGKIKRHKYDPSNNLVYIEVTNIQPTEIITPQPTLEDKVNFIYYKQIGVI